MRGEGYFLTIGGGGTGRAVCFKKKKDFPFLKLMIKINCDILISRFCIGIYKPEWTAREKSSVRRDDDITNAFPVRFLIGAVSSSILLLSIDTSRRILPAPPPTTSYAWLIFDFGFGTIVVSVVGAKKGSFSRFAHPPSGAVWPETWTSTAAAVAPSTTIPRSRSHFSLWPPPRRPVLCIPRPARRRRPARERSALSRPAGASERLAVRRVGSRRAGRGGTYVRPRALSRVRRVRRPMAPSPTRVGGRIRLCRQYATDRRRAA